MHYGSDVDAILVKTPDRVLQRFALDCAERAIVRSLRDGDLSASTGVDMRARLAQKRLHITTGAPDRAAMVELLQDHYRVRDQLPAEEGNGCDGAVCWALDVEPPVAEATREAAREAVSGLGHKPERREFTRLQDGFSSDNEEFWQMRRLRLLRSLADDMLWRLEESAVPAQTRVDFDQVEAMASLLQRERARPAEQRERWLAEVVIHIEDDIFAVDVCDVGLMVHAYGAPRGSSICEVRVRDPGQPTTFEIL